MRDRAVSLESTETADLQWQEFKEIYRSALNKRRGRFEQRHFRKPVRRMPTGLGKKCKLLIRGTVG
jgi:hypothetical protein